MEKAMSIRQLAEETGYPTEYIRAACKRDARHHRLPHIESGVTRPCIYVRASQFEQWRDEEERRG